MIRFLSIMFLSGVGPIIDNLWNLVTKALGSIWTTPLVQAFLNPSAWLTRPPIW
jgi:hypothetical protein